MLVALIRVPVVPNVLLFWIAFVLTRPLGATAGDFLTKPVAKGGLDLDTTGSSAMLLAVLVGLTGYAHAQERRSLAPAAVLPSETGDCDRATERAGRARTAPRSSGRRGRASLRPASAPDRCSVPREDEHAGFVR
ncbi:hypothetical protein [Streptomyces scabiei]|uniref:hypothetical protein n=1 Tax=Streptomyces scabiei TaxID=1930 RepID=UPI0029A376D4|nr:hypothetical protein [Streptomyces scabiei]MDX3116083.1 hypothetical protein [Streptomyces scabiei]